MEWILGLASRALPQGEDRPLRVRERQWGRRTAAKAAPRGPAWERRSAWPPSSSGPRKPCGLSPCAPQRRTRPVARTRTSGGSPSAWRPTARRLRTNRWRAASRGHRRSRLAAGTRGSPSPRRLQVFLRTSCWCFIGRSPGASRLRSPGWTHVSRGTSTYVGATPDHKRLSCGAWMLRPRRLDSSRRADATQAPHPARLSLLWARRPLGRLAIVLREASLDPLAIRVVEDWEVGDDDPG